MIICRSRLDIENEISKVQLQNKKIGFVPTMGALHEGHLSLVRKSILENDVTVVSIFVNPIQFNNSEDLENYPRTFDNDAAMLQAAGCDIVFAPTVGVMYPEGKDNLESYNFGDLESVMEGIHRPGHFNGVAVVVKRLFDLVPANNAYFGLKDFQQLAIIQDLVRQKNIPINIVPCEIVREKDGLAMSSRNTRLSKEQREQSVIISKTLFQAKEMCNSKTIDEIKKFVIETINTVHLLCVEYFEVVDLVKLQPQKNWESNKNLIGCVAVNVGEVRLIDNIIFEIK